uniref:Uncharacterized protein n=1 Tax=Romanomermis culicivorax TaxID=13658 RepID=A0A915HJ03_ROMCU
MIASFQVAAVRSCCGNKVGIFGSAVDENFEELKGDDVGGWINILERKDTKIFSALRAEIRKSEQTCSYLYDITTYTLNYLQDMKQLVGEWLVKGFFKPSCPMPYLLPRLIFLALQLHIALVSSVVKMDYIHSILVETYGHLTKIIPDQGHIHTINMKPKCKNLEIFPAPGAEKFFSRLRPVLKNAVEIYVY